MKNLPPAVVRAYANAYACTDCDSMTELKPDAWRTGAWRITVFHDAGCPVLAGHVSPVDAGVDAAARTPGTLYVGPVKP